MITGGGGGRRSLRARRPTACRDQYAIDVTVAITPAVRYNTGNAEIAGLDNDGRMCGQLTELKLQFRPSLSSPSMSSPSLSSPAMSNSVFYPSINVRSCNFSQPYNTSACSCLMSSFDDPSHCRLLVMSPIKLPT